MMKGHALKNLEPLEALPDNLRGEFWIGGLTPFTTIDFPGRLAAVLFTQGCPWRCRYCYNSHLRPDQQHVRGKIDPDEVFSLLVTRQGLLDGIVFSGGEPTLHHELKPWMELVKQMEYEVGLHTTGMFPDRLESVLPLCDWVGMDIKAPFALYETVTQKKGSGKASEASANLLIKNQIETQFRTTYHPLLLKESDIIEIAEDLYHRGAEEYIVQKFQPKGSLDEKLNQAVMPRPLLSDETVKRIKEMFPSFRIME